MWSNQFDRAALREPSNSPQTVGILFNQREAPQTEKLNVTFGNFSLLLKYLFSSRNSSWIDEISQKNTKKNRTHTVQSRVVRSHPEHLPRSNTKYAHNPLYRKNILMWYTRVKIKSLLPIVYGKKCFAWASLIPKCWEIHLILPPQIRFFIFLKIGSTSAAPISA